MLTEEQLRKKIKLLEGNMITDMMMAQDKPWETEPYFMEEMRKLREKILIYRQILGAEECTCYECTLEIKQC